jgi:hypothetical protein
MNEAGKEETLRERNERGGGGKNVREEEETRGR